MRSRPAVLVAVGALLVVAVVAARGESPISAGPGVVYRPEQAAESAPPPGEFRLEPNSFLSLLSGISTGVLLLLVLAVLLIGTAGLPAMLAGVRRRRTPAGRPGFAAADAEDSSGYPAAAALAARVRRARVELSRRAPDREPGDAVIAAWVALEAAAEGVGTPRAAHHTPTEFTAEVSAHHDVDTAALADLRGLYHRARFAAHRPLSQADADGAERALARIERSLVAR
ncbi:DUF4129 domain-containing protein [Actinokineospora spheciospongiae]|uniref:DUF4129 domain-containing protein n=1 Tax=Actinokineospora spheciospongiae TaxID=909613 RepID=UPI00126814CC|nr:DUF4129 domain-containing protein [Actinokineospora spheciospongiae]